ncbi:type II CAAX endopeptidase family protein [Lactobacillus sp. ESL0681]|uniref:CPBP family intramembrane glutamic endopeptidase n=1 Tax=Lactobacillus sp. ESL0681 TaxID=2983211 RepID=UPI0023F75861|nr:type II CAAX endopeptidase family protein [Lactobacillus sp. ESL0681]WEV41288.1 type II CAAX endopeptidase family protein [Lactobacillus sp. ESL0681]
MKIKITKNKLLSAGLGLIQLIAAFCMYSICQALILNIAIIKLSWKRWGVVFITTLAISLLIYMVIKIYQTRTRDDFDIKPHWSYNRLLWTLICTFIILFIQIIGGLLTKSTSANQTALLQLQKITNPIFIIFLIIIGPLFEELIFRGIFFNFFFTKDTLLTKIWGIFINGIIFGLCHEPNFNGSFLTYALCGMLLAIVYLKTKDLRYSYICHVGNNLLALFL